MKKLVFLFLLLLILPLISSVEFDMNEEFSQGETLMARVSGNFLLPLQRENVFFYREHVRIPLEYGIKKINEEYYIYALLSGKDADNYSIALENVRYMGGAEVSEEEIVRNFSINNQIADFSINPGFASESEFSIEVQNLQDNQITIEIKTATSTNSSGETYQDPITLISGKKQDIDFVFEFTEPTFKIIELSTANLKYEIPALIPATTIQEDEGILKFEPSGLIVSVPTNEETNEIIYLYNTKDEEIKNITISLSNSLENYASLPITNIESLDIGSNILISLTFLSEDEFELEGHIKAKQGEEIVYAPISIKFLEGYVAPEEPPESYPEKTCAELGYVICSSNEVCSSSKVVGAKDGFCCIGFCETPEKSSIGKIVGIGILILVIIMGIWFYKKKYKKAKKPVDLLKVAKGKKQNFSPSIERSKKKQRLNQRSRTPEKPVVKVAEKPIIREVIKKVFVERPEPATSKYVASTNTKKFHKSSCRLSKLIKDKYKESSDSPSDFQRKGYVPCKVCFKG